MAALEADLVVKEKLRGSPKDILFDIFCYIHVVLQTKASLFYHYHSVFANLKRVLEVGSDFGAVAFRYTKVFCRYANYAEPMPNPYDEGEGGLRVGEKGVWPRPQQPKATAAARVAAPNGKGGVATPSEVDNSEKKSTLKLDRYIDLS